MLRSNGAGCGATAVNATLGYGDVAQKADALGLTAYFGCGLGANGAADALVSVCVRADVVCGIS